MTMLALAARSIRFRTTAYLSAAISMIFGATMIMGFAAMLDVAAVDGLSATSRETLTTMASIVGGWGLVIVLFGVASLFGMLVRQRASEMALLRSAGALPGQVTRMLAAEAALLSALAVVCSLPLAWLLGRGLLDLLIRTDQVESGTEYRFGLFALSIGAGVTIGGSVIAALLAAWRSGRTGIRHALTGASVDRGRVGRTAWIAAGVFLLAGTACASVTATVMRGAGTDAMATGAQAGILSGIGLALLSPVLIRAALRLLGRPIRTLFGPAGDLAVANGRARTGTLAGILMPIILFIAISTGTFYVQLIENRATELAGLTMTNEQRNIQTLNLVVVGMIAVFAGIMLINTMIATIADRRREFAQQRLAGATPRQVAGTVVAEVTLLLLVGVIAGGFASLLTIVPFAIARLDTPTPFLDPRVVSGVILTAVGLSLVTACVSVRSTIRAPAVTSLSN